MTPKERLLALGLPVCQSAARAMKVDPLPIRDTKRANDVAGNAPSAATALLVALACFGLRYIVESVMVLTYDMPIVFVLVCVSCYCP